ncbi:MAG: hypothetical protein AB1607_14410 [Chloroflexota bacterium]
MLTYEELQTKPRQFPTFTSLTVSGFTELLPFFEKAYEKDILLHKQRQGKHGNEKQAEDVKVHWMASSRNFFLHWSK